MLLFVFPGQRNIPRWVEQLRSAFTLPDFFSQSPSALLTSASETCALASEAGLETAHQSERGDTFGRRDVERPRVSQECRRRVKKPSVIIAVLPSSKSSMDTPKNTAFSPRT
jgi:hypothetical protein